MTAIVKIWEAASRKFRRVFYVVGVDALLRRGFGAGVFLGDAGSSSPSVSFRTASSARTEPDSGLNCCSLLLLVLGRFSR